MRRAKWLSSEWSLQRRSHSKYLDLKNFQATSLTRVTSSSNSFGRFPFNWEGLVTFLLILSPFCGVPLSYAEGEAAPYEGTAQTIQSGNGDAPGAATKTAEVASETSFAISIGDAFLNMRDPFRRPDEVKTAEVDLGPLQKYPVQSYRLVGVLTGPGKVRAMLVDPSGKTHFVSMPAKLGDKGGVITKITPDGIDVREKVVNLIGKEENINIRVSMPEDTERQSSGTDPAMQPVGQPGMPPGMSSVPDTGMMMN